MSLMRLYRASDLLLRHQGRIEAFIFERVRSLFALESTVTLYDLTNTYFEGALKGNPKAARGHSKEQRSEAVLLTLGLVLDQSGFVRRSQVFAGNAVEARDEKRLVKITERIGRLKEKCRGIGQHYRIEYQTADAGKKLKALTWTKEPVAGTLMSDPGVYCLRSNETAWTPEQLWRTYVMLTGLEAVFRSLKSELGLRPIFHRKEARCDAHLFISVLAYQFVQIIRTRLADRGIHDSWASLRKILQVQRRVTSSFKTRQGRTLNVRKASLPETELVPLYTALALDSNPGGTKKLII